MPRRGKLIVLLGPVGVGKSTIIGYLSQILKVRGFRTSTVFIKAFHGLAYMLWIFVAKLLGINIKKHYAPWFVIPKSGRISLAKVLGIVSIYLDVFLSIPLKLAKVRLLKAIGHYVLSEEYLCSTLLDYMYPSFDSKASSRLVSIPMRVLNVLATKYAPDITIVLTANFSTLRHRWVMRGCGDPQPHYIVVQYTFLSKVNEALIIDTTKMSVKEVLTKVLEIIQNTS